jgi:hypothetical protein
MKIAADDKNAQSMSGIVYSGQLLLLSLSASRWNPHVDGLEQWIKPKMLCF